MFKVATFSIKIFHLPGFEKYSIYFFVFSYFCVFSIFLQTRVQNWLKLTLTGGKKRVKTGVLKIFQLFCFLIRIENVPYSIYLRMTIHTYPTIHILQIVRRMVGFVDELVSLHVIDLEDIACENSLAHPVRALGI